jgi:hypothetical protein
VTTAAERKKTPGTAANRSVAVIAITRSDDISTRVLPRLPLAVDQLDGHYTAAIRLYGVHIEQFPSRF